MKTSDSRNQSGGIPRRKFIGSGLTAAAGLTVVPSQVLGINGRTPPSDKLNIACVGIAGMGGANLAEMESENIVALCDVDKEFAAPIFNKYPKATAWTDYRRMLEKQKDIDAVVIATPDHLHAIVTKTAMELGKHVYTEKPLTRTIEEARILLETTKKTGVATQMGNHGHSFDTPRKVREYIEDGAIGLVREVHCWTNSAYGMWPQGIGRPVTKPPVPSYLNWDLWLGPAPFRTYHPVYHPNRWRGWWDFGNGALGDMACHVMDPAFYALQLGAPKTIYATHTKLGSRKGPYQMGQGFDLNIEINDDDFPVQGSCSGPEAETYPLSSVIQYKFPERGNSPPVTLTWWDGGLVPFAVQQLGHPQRNSGSLIIGDKGSISCASHGQNMTLAPESLQKEYRPPSEKYSRINGEDHRKNWIEACKDGSIAAASDFRYAGPLTEMVLLGALALRTGKKIEWNNKEMKANNLPEADQYIRTNYRSGWKL